MHSGNVNRSRGAGVAGCFRLQLLCAFGAVGEKHQQRRQIITLPVEELDAVLLANA
jgi:hypothetical protein